MKLLQSPGQSVSYTMRGGHQSAEPGKMLVCNLGMINAGLAEDESLLVACRHERRHPFRSSSQ